MEVLVHGQSVMMLWVCGRGHESLQKNVMGRADYFMRVRTWVEKGRERKRKTGQTRRREREKR